MSNVIYPNDGIKKIESIFLGGTIDNGNSWDFQQYIIEKFKDVDIKLYNPRRLDWDSSWKQNIENKPFNEQVSWELTCLEKADIIIMYFAPNSVSPISLLELGLFKDKCIVCCPEGYWRKGNIDIVCDRYNIPNFDNLDSMINNILLRL